MRSRKCYKKEEKRIYIYIYIYIYPLRKISDNNVDNDDDDDDDDDNNNNNNKYQEITKLRNYRKQPYWALHTYCG